MAQIRHDKIVTADGPILKIAAKPAEQLRMLDAIGRVDVIVIRHILEKYLGKLTWRVFLTTTAVLGSLGIQRAVLACDAFNVRAPRDARIMQLLGKMLMGPLGVLTWYPIRALRLRQCIHVTRKRGVLSRHGPAGSGPLVARHGQVHAPCEVETGNGHKRRSAKQAHRCGVLGYEGARRKWLVQRNALGGRRGCEPPD